jgi:acetyl-CoA/propionyl-CoA carboxylase biotin carboxyl carrier protein
VTFRRLAVANRGEIALRVIRACRELGVESVALFVPDDSRAVHVRAADDAVEVASYLDAGAVAAAAVEGRAQALHPGYGFLSEDAALAEACAEAGVVFVGPSPPALRALARKDEARRLGASRGGPVVPGGDDPAAVGYPLLVKAAAGGGGRGMRVVRSEGELEEAVAAARREAEAAFGSPDVLFERYLEEPRHVEIQMLRDREGHGIHLGERDCSVQRRYQKVLEEAPAPGVTAELRRALGASALGLAEAVDYVGAGTAEFLLDGENFYFLELNARIQVEHPVTEAVTATDLVRRQIEIAAGLPLGLDQEDLVLRGHAVEVRLYAEDPDAGFLPRAGTVLDLRWPAGPGIRVDAGVERGDVVGTRYDPLLAKIIAHGEDREHAFERLASALDETRVLGLTTNLGFLRWLAREPELRAGPVSTRFLDRRWRPSPEEEPPDEVREAAERYAAAEQGGDPFTGRWRAGERREPPALVVARDPAGDLHVWDGARSRVVPRRGLDDAAALAHAPSAGREAEHVRLTAPMPGSILRVEVAAGDRVEARQPLLVLEAMKMEHPLLAPIDGVVESVSVETGATVQAGDALLSLRS